MEKQAKKEEFRFQVQLKAKELWLFSLYHSYRGMMGIFGLLFTVAALFLIVTKWNEVTTSYRLLLVICVLLFSVWQPAILYGKAKRQAALPAMQLPLELCFCESGFAVKQKEEQIECAWADIFAIVELPQMLILYTDSIHAYLLTNQAMGEEREGFLAVLHTWVPKEQIKIRRRFFW
ncbi:MAG: YcxB family protein [bacterium]|nr:YcxB family protein [bacterium]